MKKRRKGNVVHFRMAKENLEHFEELKTTLAQKFGYEFNDPQAINFAIASLRLTLRNSITDKEPAK